MNNLYSENGKTYLKVDLEKLNIDTTNYSINDISDFNTSIVNSGLQLVDSPGGEYRIEVKDMETYSNYITSIGTLQEEVEAILLQDLPVEVKADVEAIIGEYKLDIDIDDIESGQDLLDATRNEIEAAMESGGSPTDITGAVSMLANISTRFVLDKLNVEGSVLVDTDIERGLYSSTDALSYAGAIMIAAPVTIEYGIGYMTACLGLEFVPVPGARIIATLGGLMGAIAIAINTIMEVNEADDIVTTGDLWNNNIYINGQVIDINYDNINDASQKFLDILATNVQSIKLELTRLEGLRNAHIKGAAERLKYYYFNNAGTLAGHIVYSNDNILKRNYGFCDIEYIFKSSDIANLSYCPSEIITASSDETTITVTIPKYYDSSNGLLDDELDATENTVTENQQDQIKEVIIPHIENMILNFDFLSVVQNYANSSENGIQVNSYEVGTQVYMSNSYLTTLISEINILNNQLSTTIDTLITGAAETEALDKQIASGWSQ